MCGLSGAAGAVTFAEEKVVKDLLVLNQLRGDDATGIASVDRTKINGEYQMKLAKDIGPPYFLFDTSRFNKVFAGTNCAFIGHNRSRTVGENTRKNAHPFRFDNIIGAHNGTIDYQNKARLEDASSFSTDSEAIFNNIQVHGIEDTISRIDNTEAYALTWYDNRDHTINFVRNQHRPLLWTNTKDGKVMFWASEYGMLMLALHRAGMKPDDKVWEFTEDWHWSWRIPEHASDELGAPTRKKLTNHVKPIYIHNNQWSKKKETSEQKTFPSMKPGQTSSVGRGYVGDSFGYDEEEADDRCPEGYVWGGMYAGCVPKGSVVGAPDSTKAAIVTNITKHLDTVKNLFHKKIEPTTNPRQMTPDDVIRRRAYEQAEKAGLVLTLEECTDKGIFRIHKGSNLEVWRTSSTGRWTYLRYNSLDGAWDLYKDMQEPPKDLPFTLIDIDARHCFKHVRTGTGKHKKKTIYYKGFNKVLLDRERFEKVTAAGCTGCSRCPEWGNEVTFISPHSEFLCEWCSMTPGVVKEFLDLNKKVA